MIQTRCVGLVVARRVAAAACVGWWPRAAGLLLLPICFGLSRVLALMAPPVLGYDGGWLCRAKTGHHGWLTRGSASPRGCLLRLLVNIHTAPAVPAEEIFQHQGSCPRERLLDVLITLRAPALTARTHARTHACSSCTHAQPMHRHTGHRGIWRVTCSAYMLRQPWPALPILAGR